MKKEKHPNDKVLSQFSDNVVHIQSKLESVNASLIIPKEQPWLWRGVIPLHTLTLFAGEGGIGKSQLLLDIAAKVSTGEIFQAGGQDHKLIKGKVLILTAEDDLEYTVSLKLLSSNADLTQIEIVKTVTGDNRKRVLINLNTQIDLIKSKINEMKNVKLIIIDPILYFIGEINDNLNSEVANFLNTLIEFAKDYDLAIIINKHFRKKSSGKNVTSAADEVGGAGAWTNSPRLSWAITRYHDDPKLNIISNIKSNITEKTEEVLAYRIKSYIVIVSSETGESTSINTTQLVWHDKMVSITANEAVNKETFDKSKKQIAADFIISYLEENGQSIAKKVKEAATVFRKDIKLRTFEDAIRDLKINKTIKIEKGFGKNKVLSLMDCGIEN